MKHWLKRLRSHLPDSSWLFFAGGAAAAIAWMVNLVQGSHADGGFPGAMVGLWAVWAAMRRDAVRRDYRRRRYDEDERDEE